MAVKIEPPNKHDNSWETNSIVINSQIDFERLASHTCDDI
jgi:hypothetical protein